MSVAMLERAARELDPFLDQVAFVGGATVGLWITDPGAPEPRATKDVDVVVEVASRLAWYSFEERLRAHGLRHDSSDLEDVIGLVDGRPEIVKEVMTAPSDLRAFIANEIASLLDESRFLETVDGSIVGFGRRREVGGSGREDRVDKIVLPRFKALAGR